MPYTLSGDDRPAIAYTIPLITSDGTIYGVVGIEMLVSYLQSLLPYSELQNESNGTYLLFSASAASLNSEPPSQIICRTAVCSTGNGMTLLKRKSRHLSKNILTVPSGCEVTEARITFPSHRLRFTAGMRHFPMNSGHWPVPYKHQTCFIFPGNCCVF